MSEARETALALSRAGRHAEAAATMEAAVEARRRDHGTAVLD